MNLADYKQVDTEDVIQDAIKRYRENTKEQMPWHCEEAFRQILDEKYFVGIGIEPKPVKWFFRVTYPLYIFWVIFHHLILGSLKWIITGDSSFDRKTKYYKLMIKWEKGIDGKL
jgi:hypothetical protein